MSTTVQDLSTVRLKISNLERLEYTYVVRDGESSTQQNEDLILTLPGDTPLSTLWTKIAEAKFRAPQKLTGADSKVWYKWDQKNIAEPFDGVEVVEHSSSDSKSIGLDEKLIAFTDRHYGEPLQLNIDEDKTSHGGLSDCLKDSRGLKITFLRTTRMPDDDKLHPLPAALGTFPLYSVDAHAKALPDDMVEEGGVFMPMWQREALWIGFECRTTMRYALRISVGRINAVSGKEMEQTRSNEDDSPAVQDYVVVPGQQWLDGICVGSGVVRQFVAMPLGSGYTVEGQKTGQEKHGGLQIEIIPAYQPRLRTWLRDGDVPENSNELYGHLQSCSVSESSTPRQDGLEPGTKLRVYPNPAFKTLPCSLSDIARHENELVELLASYPSYPPRTYLYSEETKRGRVGHSSHEASNSMSGFAGPENMSFLKGSMGTMKINNGASYSQNTVTGASFGDSGAFSEAQGSEVNDETHHESEEVRAATQRLKTMGLAAGGKLMQDINEDTNLADTWNTAASKLVHIHILDPVSCEAVTHIVPPPPPIDAKTYAESNMPFFVLEEKPDERLEGGDFDNVKSVSAMDKERGVSEEPSLDPTKPIHCQCAARLCDCVVRPCNHTFCNVCIKGLDPKGIINWSSQEPAQKADWKCPTCQKQVAYVAGFSAPMNLPGEESIKMRVPVNVLEVRDGRPAFKSVHKARI